MGFNERRKERAEARLERRASRGPSARERAMNRMRERNGEPPVRDASSNGDGGNGNGDGPRRRLRVLPGGGGGNGDNGVEEQRTKPRLKKLRAALVFMGLALLALVSWVFGIMTAVAGDLPALENRAQFERAENSIIVDRNGTRLATLTNNEGRSARRVRTRSPPSMKEAVVAIEDRRFYEHRGVDYQGIARALYQDVLAGSAEQGASTITQQFVKNALAAQEDRTVFQKLREAALAYQLERHWTKDKIITEYLNSIYFGEGAYGIEAAAKTYFGSAHPGCGEEGQPTCASELLPWEAAMLAGIIASPDVYSPPRLVAKDRAEQQAEAQVAKDGEPRPREHARRGLHHRGGVRGLLSEPLPSTSDRAPVRRLHRPILHLLAPPAARRQVRRRRGLRRRPRRQIHP